MGLLSNPSLKLLVLDLFLEHANHVLVEIVKRIHHDLALLFFLLQILLELSFLRQKFILLKLGGKLVDLLAQANLLSISLVIERLLMIKQLFLEFTLFDLLSFQISLKFLICL